MSDLRKHGTPIHEIRARTGFFPITVTCRLGDDGLHILRGADVTRIGYDAFASLRFDRRGSGHAALVLAASDGRGASFLFKPGLAPDAEVTAFAMDLGKRVARASPAARLVIGPSRRQWVASWIGVCASGLVLLGAALALWAGGAPGSVLVPTAVALVNLGIVLPILRAGPPRTHAMKDAAAALGGSEAIRQPHAP